LPEVKPTREDIIALIEPVLEAQGLDLVDLEFARLGSRWLVRIYMDREGGVTLQDCSDMSRLIGDILDVNDLPPGPYNLEVSSPGLDRPLKREKDFIKYKGKQAKIRLREKLDGSRNFRGVLAGIVEEGGRKFVVLEADGKEFRLPMDQILKANLEYEI